MAAGSSTDLPRTAVEYYPSVVIFRDGGYQAQTWVTWRVPSGVVWHLTPIVRALCNADFTSKHFRTMKVFKSFQGFTAFCDALGPPLDTSVHESLRTLVAAQRVGEVSEENRDAPTISSCGAIALAVWAASLRHKQAGREQGVCLYYAIMDLCLPCLGIGDIDWIEWLRDASALCELGGADRDCPHVRWVHAAQRSHDGREALFDLLTESAKQVLWEYIFPRGIQLSSEFVGRRFTNTLPTSKGEVGLPGETSSPQERFPPGPIPVHLPPTPP